MKTAGLSIKDVIEKLTSNPDETFMVNTIGEVVDIIDKFKEGDKWSKSSLNVSNLDKSNGEESIIRLNLWDRFSTFVNDVEIGDVLEIRNGWAKNYSYGDRRYPQINCDEKYGTLIEIRYDKERILIDGSNIAWTIKKEGKPNIDNIAFVERELKKHNFVPITIVDPTLRHNIPDSDKDRFNKMLDSDMIIQAPAQVRADDALLKYADERGLKIISNDTFREYIEIYPWLEDKSRRVPFNIIEGKPIFYFKDAENENIKKNKEIEKPKQIDNEGFHRSYVTELYEKLKLWRNRLASRDGVVPYVIAHNKWLMEMARLRVRSNHELKQIKGFGQKRIEKYGDQIVEIIKDFDKEWQESN